MSSPVLNQRILFFAETDYVAKLYLSVARALKALQPRLESVLVDVSVVGPGNVSSAPVFDQAGFRAIAPPGLPTDDRRDRRLEYLRQFQKLFNAEQPAAIVVPHELGYAAVAVALAHHLGISTYQIQHGDYLPTYFSKEMPLVKVSYTKSTDLYSAQRFWQAQHTMIRQEYRLLQKAFSALSTRLRQKLYGMRSPLYGKHSSAERELRALLTQLMPSPQTGSRYTFTTSKVGVAGEYYKRRLLAMGLTDDRIDVTGYLRSDLFASAPLQSYAALCAQYQLDPTQPLVLYFYSPVGGYPVAYDPIEAILDAIHAVRAVAPDWNILILNHPRKPMSLLEPVMRWGFSNVQVGRAGDNFWSLCQAARLIIGVMSAALTEAILARKPILTQNYVFFTTYNSLLIEFGAVIPVFYRFHMQERVMRAIRDRPFVERIIANQAAAATELLGPFDGKCGERTAQGILGILAKAVN